MKKYRAIVNARHIIEANTLPALKRIASTKANNTFQTFDCMEITHIDGNLTKAREYTLYRMNEKRPNNTIRRGSWR